MRRLNFNFFLYVERYVFRICDVFCRITILSLVWIILPAGGLVVFIIIIVESLLIVYLSYESSEFNKLQFLLATYYVERVDDTYLSPKQRQKIDETYKIILTDFLKTCFEL